MLEPHCDLPTWLRGRWTIERAINDGTDHFSGTAEFTSTDAGVTRWEEHGQLTFGSYTGPAYRTLLLEPGTGTGCTVTFHDGRPFHDLDLSGGRWQAEHLCGPDVYRGTFTVDGTDRFTVTWRVTGPGRDDTIASDYRRIGPPGHTGGTGEARSGKAA